MHLFLGLSAIIWTVRADSAPKLADRATRLAVQQNFQGLLGDTDWQKYDSHVSTALDAIAAKKTSGGT